MKILKLLNKKHLSIIIISLSFCPSLFAEEKPVDIWNLDKEKAEKIGYKKEDAIIFKIGEIKKLEDLIN